MVDTGPVVIGGMGGASTRIYRALAVTGGYTMHSRSWLERQIEKEPSHDCWLLDKTFYRRWAGRYLSNQLTPIQERGMRAHLKTVLWLCGPMSYQRKPWGWKNPNTMSLISFFNSVYPQMKYIHVIRDGRNHAFHPRFPYYALQDAFLSEEEIKLPDHERKALMWTRTNQHGEKEGTALGPNRYIRSRFEDLVSHPETEVKRILNFLGVDDADKIKQAVRLIKKPASWQRWRSAPVDHIKDVEALIGDDLEHYGYELANL